MQNHPLMISVASMISLIVMAVATSSLHVAGGDVHWMRIVIASSMAMGLVFFLHHCWTLAERGLQKRFRTCQLVVVFGFLPFLGIGNLASDLSYRTIPTEIERNMAAYDLERFILEPVRRHAGANAHLILGDEREGVTDPAPDEEAIGPDAEREMEAEGDVLSTSLPGAARSHSLLAYITAEAEAPDVVRLQLDGLTDFSCRGIAWTLTRPQTFQIYDRHFRSRSLTAVSRKMEINGQELDVGDIAPDLREMYRLCSSDGRDTQQHSMEVIMFLRPTVDSDPPPQGVL